MNYFHNNKHFYITVYKQFVQLLRFFNVIQLEIYCCLILGIREAVKKC